WLYVVALRVFRLPSPVVIADHPSYAGCRSWIPFKAPIPATDSTPVLDETTYTNRLATIDRVLNR
ncbi:MAG TPA: DUF1802 family protein, partial [Planctomycetota bacterium]|nr:DUF1802 family protein [Planctomycetota bacterium]